MGLVEEAMQAGARLESICNELGIDARTVQRWRNSGTEEDQRRGPHTVPANALTPREEEAVVKVLTSSEFAGLSPNQVVPKLADKKVYIASERTMYRILKRERLLTHRDRSRPRKHKRPEERISTGPCQTWSWDITYLPTPIRGRFWMLYMVMDVWSRKIVAAHVYEREGEDLAAVVVGEACKREGVPRDKLRLHSDNGAAMKGQVLHVKLKDLGVSSSFSRPRTSNDNPYSESLFRTLKYRPEYPTGVFESIESAQKWVDRFVHWYNKEHKHSGIRFVTPTERHEGREAEILANRRRVYRKAKKKNPERWSGSTRDWTPIQIVRLNPGRQPPRSEASKGIHAKKRVAENGVHLENGSMPQGVARVQ
jgi:transposase InsO family protein